MVNHGRGLHHHRKLKKEILIKREQTRFMHKWDKWSTPLIYFFGIFGQIMTLPQIINIWVYNQTAGVSILTWTSYLFASFFWLFYGFIHREKSILLTYFIWILLQLVIVLGLIVKL